MLTNLKQMVDYSEKMEKALSDEVQPLMLGTENANMDTLLQFYFLLKKLRDHAENMSKLFGLCEPQLSDRINKQIVAMGLESVDKTIDGIRIRVTPDTKWYITCKKDSKHDLIQWMKNDPNGRELVKEDVHPKTMESFFKEMLQSGGVPPAFLSIHSTETITTRKLPNK